MMPNKNDHDTLIAIKADVGYIRDKLDEVTANTGLNRISIDSLERFRDKVYGGAGVFAIIVGAVIAKLMNLF